MWQQLPTTDSLVGWASWSRRRRLSGLVGLFALAAVLAVAGAEPAGSAVAPRERPRVAAPAASAGGVFRTAGVAGWRALSVSGGSAAGCGRRRGLVCSQVEVPLDRAGRLPGSISLLVEVLPAAPVRRGVLFLLAGGPGQPSAKVFGLGSGSAGSAEYYRFLFPGYTLVAFDGRGSGNSGPLDCPALRAPGPDSSAASVGAACAASLGPQRDFYGTGDQAEDIEAVRQTLGVDRVALWGTSYGTKLALAYALAHPDHVERLLLDSVLPPDLPQAFASDVLQMLPHALADYCAGSACRAATADFAGDVVALANTLQAAPLRGRVRQPGGSSNPAELNGLQFLGLVLNADLDPALAAELPAAVHAARRADPRPLLRIADIYLRNSDESSDELNATLYAASVCRDGFFPWQPETPLDQRQQLLDAWLNELPAQAFGPFGSWAAGLGDAGLCLQWPSANGGTHLGAGPLPDVPVLALSGGSDMRTPTLNASSVAARFPHGQLLVVPGVGHAVLEATGSCAQRAVRNWVLGHAVPARCPRPGPLLAPLTGYPTPNPAPQRLNPAQTLALAASTIQEADATWLMAAGSSTAPARIAGIYAGTLHASGQRTFTLQHYSITPGVMLSGKIRLTTISQPLTFTGTLTISGATAAAGNLTLAGAHLNGTLAGESVHR